VLWGTVREMARIVRLITFSGVRKSWMTRARNRGSIDGREVVPLRRRPSTPATRAAIDRLERHPVVIIQDPTGQFLGVSQLVDDQKRRHTVLFSGVSRPGEDIGVHYNDQGNLPPLDCLDSGRWRVTLGLEVGERPDIPAPSRGSSLFEERDQRRQTCRIGVEDKHLLGCGHLKRFPWRRSSGGN
jgi:hypothetical protein